MFVRGAHGVPFATQISKSVAYRCLQLTAALHEDWSLSDYQQEEHVTASQVVSARKVIIFLQQCLKNGLFFPLAAVGIEQKKR